jgi:uncharacterized phosphosugar-binding protein
VNPPDRPSPSPNATDVTPLYAARQGLDGQPGATPDNASTAVPSAGCRYLATAADLIARLADATWPVIAQAAVAVADALGAGRVIHVFGTGHSHLLAEEMYYRAGGLVAVSPILFDGLMLHHSTARSTALERLPGLAEALLADHPIHDGDVILIASNSGGNATTIDMALTARHLGATVIAITSLQHATSALARSTDAPRLHTLADIVIDNGGAVGDAAVEIAGFDRAVAPTSTVVGAAIVNAIVAEATEILVQRGMPPEVYRSLNTATGNADHQRAAAHPTESSKDGS